MKKYILKLYISGSTDSAIIAINSLKSLLGSELKEKYSLEIIDIVKNPDIAEKEKILATPLLIKELPPPVRRIVGNLANKQNILAGLDLV